MHKMVKNQNL